VVCDSDSYAYLLGAPIFSGSDVKRATPIAPTADGVTTQWRIALSISSAAGERMWDWTSQHHSQFLSGMFGVTQTSSTPPCGTTVRTACADFLAYVNDGAVVTVPVTYDPFRTAIIVSGDFDKASATRLAAAMAR
jgi:preprotein translocase subunit SecD